MVNASLLHLYKGLTVTFPNLRRPYLIPLVVEAFNHILDPRDSVSIRVSTTCGMHTYDCATSDPASATWWLSQLAFTLRKRPSCTLPSERSFRTHETASVLTKFLLSTAIEFIGPSRESAKSDTCHLSQ